MNEKTSDIRDRYDRIAQIYDFWDLIPERLLYKSWRQELWNTVSPGNILEIGVGTGKNICFYPSSSRVIAIDISRKMLEKAGKRARMRQDLPIELIEMDVGAMSFQDNVFDTVVGSFILTVLPDPLRALQEIRRVCRPTGKLLVLEFTHSNNRVVSFIQDFVTPLTRVVYKAQVNRRITRLVESSGFQAVSAKEVGDGIVKIVQAVVP